MDLIEYRSLLYRAAHAQRQLLHPFMATIGLGTGQPKLLTYLAHFGSCSPRELAAYYELDPAGVSRMLDTLERKGFVKIEQNAEDRRAKVVALTPEGERVSHAWDAACREEASAMLEGFSTDERAAFADYLARAHRNLKGYGQKLVAAQREARAREAQREQQAAEGAAPSDEHAAVTGDAAASESPDDVSSPAIKIQGSDVSVASPSEGEIRHA